MSHPMLTTTNLSIGYRSRINGDKVIASTLNLNLKRGEMVCLLGPNGAGKSTLMRTLSGLLPKLSGKVCIEEQDLDLLHPSSLAQKLSLVLTDRVEVGNLDVEDVVTLGRTPYTSWLGNLNASDRQRIHSAMEVTGILHMKNQNLNALSDGERQKVMLARALAQDTPIILLDEPTAHLDLPSRVEMMRLLHQLARTMGKAVLLSTHELDLALQAADRLWLMPSHGELLTGTPEDLVLNGGFETTFTKTGFYFNVSTGTFTIHTEPVTLYVEIIGDPQRVFWARRALLREGIGMKNGEGAECQIIADGYSAWTVSYRGILKNFDTLEQVVDTVKNWL
jgi:iron complex transport system ATP-binding protein